jgi:hypothetical protein
VPQPDYRYTPRRKTGPVTRCAAPGCADPHGGRCWPSGRPKRLKGLAYGVAGDLCETCFKRLNHQKRAAAKRAKREAAEAPGGRPRVIPEGAGWCARCRRPKPGAAFSPCPKHAANGGLRYWCRWCERITASVRAGTAEHRAWRAAYRARPERREAARLAAARRRRERPDAQAAYRQTPRRRALNALDAARRRLRANPASRQVAATVAAWEAELARMGWEPRPRRRAAS